MAKKKKSNRLIRNLVIVVVILITLTLIARWAGWFGKEKLPEVYTAIAKKVDVEERVSASGKIQPEVEVKISPEVSGEIVEVLIKEGDSVHQGQLLLRIRPDILREVVQSSQATYNSIRSNLAQAQAQLLQQRANMNRLETEYNRNKGLFEQKVISETDFLTAKTNFEVAKQQVAASEKSLEAAGFNVQSSQANLNQQVNNLARTEIYAPASGTISKLSVEKGEKVVGTAQMAGTEMLRLANLNTMEVEVDVNENDIIKIKNGQKVIIEVDSYVNRKFEGIVTEIANTANATTSTDAVTEFKVKIRILNESYKDLVQKGSNLSPFRPGMTASVEIITNRKEKVLTVPLSAVTTRADEDKNVMQKTSNTTDDKTKKTTKAKEMVFVYDAKEKKVVMREVKTGISDFDNIEILSGLKEGDEIVIGPFNLVSKQLKDEQKVNKIDKKDFSKGKN